MLIANSSVRDARPYSVPRAQAPTDLRLDGNEGPDLDEDALRELSEVPQLAQCIRRYPSASALERRLADRFGVTPEQVLVSAGGDDIIDRCCRAILRPGRSLALPVPGFAMTRRYAQLAGATVVEIPWTGGFPTDACLNVDDGMVVVTSPNNPTGAVATEADVQRLCAGKPNSLVLVDAAYTEFADVDLTRAALRWPNAVVVRTLSKAWGLAGLRVGYAIGPERIIQWLRSAGAPYPVSGPALAWATRRLERGEAAMNAFVQQARAGRTTIERTLEGLGATVQASQGNFAFARVPDPLWLRDGMAGLGIAIRAFPGRDHLTDAVRISAPAEPALVQRTCDALTATLAPQALLLDLDGVVADVRASYRQAIVQTAAHFGVRIDVTDVLRAKAGGGANNDWIVTADLMAARGVQIALDDVTAVFEDLVQGTDGRPGLWQRESLLVPRQVLVELAQCRPLAAVTGRPRVDAERFLAHQGIADLFDAVVCMEDAPAKPRPEPVRLALDALGVRSAWMVGDTPDDARAARTAGVVPIGVRTGDVPDEQLFAAGCARVLPDLSDVVGLLNSLRAEVPPCVK